MVQDFEDGRNVQELDEQSGPIRIVEAYRLRVSIGELIKDKISV